MRQIATAPDGVGYVVETFAHSVLKAGEQFADEWETIAALTEDGMPVAGDVKCSHTKHPCAPPTHFSSMAAARERARARSRERIGEGSPSNLTWRTEA